MHRAERSGSSSETLLKWASYGSNLCSPLATVPRDSPLTSLSSCRANIELQLRDPASNNCGALVLETRPFSLETEPPSAPRARSLMQMPATTLRDHQPPLGHSKNCPQEIGTRPVLTRLQCLLPQPTPLTRPGPSAYLPEVIIMATLQE